MVYNSAFHCTFIEQNKALIQTLRLSHCTLDIECSHILPVLLQKGDQEIDSKIDICHKFILTHFNMANGHSKTENLKFNSENTNLLYQISWPPQMVVAVLFSLHTGSFSTNVAKKIENKVTSLHKTRYQPHVPETYENVTGTCKCCFYKALSNTVPLRVL